MVIWLPYHSRRLFQGHICAIGEIDFAEEIIDVIYRTENTEYTDTDPLNQCVAVPTLFFFIGRVIISRG